MQPEPFGKYLLLERIAQGGMAEVFRAVYQGAAGVEKTVALKRILPALGGASDFVAMFIDEARIAASLTHVNIAQVFEFGEVDGAYYLAMELVEGADLGRLAEAARRRRLPLPYAVAAFIVAEAARGLAYAHEKRSASGTLLGIVHRDISPQNLLVSYAGEVKIADFGIAKATGKLHKTESGAVMGKLRYMSPEQVTGEPLDGRSDLFALGVVLHELLTGRTLFDGDHPGRVADQVKSAQVAAPSASAPEIPPELDRICLQALERDRGLRYQRAADLARDLSRLVGAHAPGLGREELGALCAELVPQNDPAPPALAGATTVEIGVSAPRRTPVLPMAAVASGATERARPAPPRHSVSAAAPARSDAKSGASRSRVRPLVLGLAVLTALAAGALVATHPELLHPGGRADPVTSPPPIAAIRDGGVHDLASPRTDALAPPSVALPPIAPAERQRLSLALSSLPRADATRRGVPAEDYLALLSAVDGALCASVGGEPTFPPQALSRLTPLGLLPEATALARYLFATGELPPEVKGPFIAFLSHHPAYSPGTPSWAMAHLAALIQPKEPKHLVDLMRQSSADDEWRARTTAPTPTGPFLPLCDRALVVARLQALEPGPLATLLGRFLTATPVGAPLDAGGLRYTVSAAAREEAAGRIDLDLEIANPSGAQVVVDLSALALEGASGTLGPPEVKTRVITLAGGEKSEQHLTFTGVTDPLADVALLTVHPGAALQAYSELLR